MKIYMNVCICALSSIFLSACATVPNGGYHGTVKTLGIPGPILGAVQVGEGLLVQTIKVDDNTELNIQINEDKVESDPLLFDNVLTIGKFSKIVGSGFSKNKNIYYQKRIHDSGKDSFMLNTRTFLVTWKCDEKDARTYPVSDHYAVDVRELFPLITDE